MGNERTKQQREDDRIRISELLVQGWCQRDIAKELGLSKYVVHRDIKVIERHRKMVAVKNVDELRQRELAKLDLIEREAWAAWERSKKKFKKDTIKTRKKILLYAEHREEERTGDRGYLDIILACQKRRAELQGLDAPAKVDMTLKDVVISVTKMDLDEL